MYTLVLILHVIVSLILIAVILFQAERAEVLPIHSAEAAAGEARRLLSSDRRHRIFWLRQQR